MIRLNMRSLGFALLGFAPFFTQAENLKCSYVLSSYSAQLRLSELSGGGSEAAQVLLKAEQEGYQVAVEEGGLMGDTVGAVSDIRIVGGKLTFRINGNRYNPTFGISVRLLEKPIEIKDRAGVLQALEQNPSSRAAAESLFKALDDGYLVAIREGGLMEETKGGVSDIQIINGRLVFKINGKEYHAKYGITVFIKEKQETLRNRAAILHALKGKEEATMKVAALFKAVDQNLRVAIGEFGVIESTDGYISDVRLENGKLAFKIDGDEYLYDRGFAVRFLQ